ncbi:MAG: hypothetical protein GY795_06520 [Desulfobacterales bacterium]|nr:hypothetical protein [Desulfobacterales bacterium]
MVEIIIVILFFLFIIYFLFSRKEKKQKEIEPVISLEKDMKTSSESEQGLGCQFFESGEEHPNVKKCSNCLTPFCENCMPGNLCPYCLEVKNDEHLFLERRNVESERQEKIRKWETDGDGNLMSKIFYHIDHNVLYKLMSKIINSNIPYGQLKPVLAITGTEPIHELIGIIDVSNGNYISIEIYCSDCSVNTLPHIDATTPGDNHCICQQCGKRILDCIVYNMLEEVWKNYLSTSFKDEENLL